MRPLVALALLAAFAPAAPVPKAVKKVSDADLIVGTWKPAEGRTEWFEFTADGGMKAWNTGGSAKSGAAYTYTLDSTASPKRMTWYAAGQSKPSWECIYELDGDSLTIQYVGTGSQLPTQIGKGNSGFNCDLRRDTSAK